MRNAAARKGEPPPDDEEIAAHFAELQAEWDRSGRFTVAAEENEARKAAGLLAKRHEEYLGPGLEPAEHSPISTWEPVDIEALLAGGIERPEPGILTRTDGARLLYPGKVHAVYGEPESGKAQPLDAPVLTPRGWRPMGSLKVGSRVIGANGRPTKVTGVFPQGIVPIYRVVCSDGAEVECSGDHLWLTKHNNDLNRGGPGTVRTALEVRQRLLEPGSKRDLYLPMVDPIQYPKSKPLPLDPYLLGALLGDGGLTKNITFTSGDEEMFARLDGLVPANGRLRGLKTPLTVSITSARGTKANPITAILRQLGLMGHKSEAKFIPPAYLVASVGDRLALLQGLMDTDGGMERKGVRYSSSSPQLAADVQRLIESLGGTASMRTKITPCLPSYQINVRLPPAIGCPFRLNRKVLAWSADRQRRMKDPLRRIVAVEYVGEKAAQCIAVASPDHLYVTNRHVLTHNTWLSMAACDEVMRLGGTAMYVDYESDAISVIERMCALGSRERLAKQFVYIRPDEPIGDETTFRLLETIAKRKPELAILDGVTEILASNAWDQNSSTDIAAFHAALPRLLERHNIGVLMVDHVAKNKDGRRFASGSPHKLAAITGAAFRLEVTDPIRRGHTGMARVIVTKDRPGAVREKAYEGYDMGVMVVQSHPGGNVSIRFARSMAANA